MHGVDVRYICVSSKTNEEDCAVVSKRVVKVIGLLLLNSLYETMDF